MRDGKSDAEFLTLPERELLESFLFHLIASETCSLGTVLQVLLMIFLRSEQVSCSFHMEEMR